MKTLYSAILIFLSFCSLAQTDPQISFKVIKNDTTLQINGSDTSYIYNAYVISENANSITSVNLIMNILQGGSWVVSQNQTFTWSVVGSAEVNTAAFTAKKLNTNILNVCLGRFYFSSRKKFTLNVTTNTGSTLKEFTF